MSEEMLFHCLSIEEWAKVTTVLSYSEVKVLYYLLCQNPMGDRKVDCRIKTVAQFMKMSTGAVSGAIKQLERKGFIDSVEIVQAVINFKPRFISERAQRYLDKNGLEPLSDKGVHSTETQFHSTETQLHSTETFVQSIESQFQSDERLHNIDRVRETIQTNTDLTQTLSEKSESEKRKTVCILDKPEETKLQCSATLTTEPETQRTSLAISTRKNAVVARRAEPFYNRRVDPKDVQWDWLPNGAWKTERGKLDENFLMFVAQNLQKAHGEDIHKKRADALAMFMNAPAKLSIHWEYYQNTVLHKAANIQTRKLAGVDTTLDEQEILKHGRASVQLPQEMRVTEERTPQEILKQVAPHTLAVVGEECQVLPEAPKDEFGVINPAAYQSCITAEDTAYWENVHARHASTENSDTGNTKQPPAAVPDELSKAKALVESIREKRERTRTLTSIAEVFSPKEAYAATLDDMRKYLNSGSDTYRQIALNWASDPINGCELVKVNGRVVDIREMEF
ncbi:hypothetical protein [Scytonema sp. PCC 10023]|uniref:hypothetical protein n=1 Tax=Scytonema sp. PCC 10023 TaxID=1680591 RepID=UPI0039C6AB43